LAVVGPHTQRAILDVKLLVFPGEITLFAQVGILKDSKTEFWWQVLERLSGRWLLG
jgi:hypothetical protein